MYLNIQCIFISLYTSRFVSSRSSTKQTQLLDSKTMLYARRENFKNFDNTTMNTIFRLVKRLADLSTRL